MNAKREELPVKTFKDVHAIMVVSFVSLLCFLLPLTTRSQQLATVPNLIPGQTATKLADGRLLLVGGESAGAGINAASIWDVPRSRIGMSGTSRSSIAGVIGGT